MKKYLIIIMACFIAAPVSAETVYRSYDSQTGYTTTSYGSGVNNYQNNTNNNYKPLYHTQRDNLPSTVGNQKIEYGYNAQGDYMPKSIGGVSVEYGMNAQGQYVPTSIAGKKVEYGYNAQGQYVPVSIDGNKIDFDMSKLM